MPMIYFTVAGIQENKITEQKAAGQLSAGSDNLLEACLAAFICRQENFKPSHFYVLWEQLLFGLGSLAVLLFRNIIHCGKCRKLCLISAVCDASGRAAALRLPPYAPQITVKNFFDLLTAGKFQFIGLRPVTVKDCSKVFFFAARSNT